MARRQRRSARRSPALSLSDRLNLLSPKRREIIAPALNRPRGFVLLSIRVASKALKTDPATMVRIVRGMRFHSYREFQHYLHELSIAHATSLDTMRPAGVRRFNVPTQVKASLDQDVKNLHTLVERFDARRVRNLVKRIYSARNILIIGGDLAVNLVRFLEHHFMILGFSVSCAASAGEVVHRVRHVGKQDLAIAISFHRGLRQTVEGIRQAQENGAYCVGVTDTVVSPIGQFVDECFITPVETPGFGASYVAPMALLNAVVTACANYRRARTLKLLKKVDDEQRHGFRWYQN